MTKKLGDRIRQLRLASHMRAVELAELTGLLVSAISHLEAGRRGISVKNLKLIAKALGLPMEALIEDDHPAALARLEAVPGKAHPGKREPDYSRDYIRKHLRPKPPSKRKKNEVSN